MKAQSKPKKARNTPTISREALRQKIIDTHDIDIENFVLLLNREKHSVGESSCPDDLMVTLRKLKGRFRSMQANPSDLHMFSLTHQQRAQWNAGVALLIKIGVFEQVEQQASGGQRDTATEKVVKNVFGVTAYLGREYVGYLIRRLRPAVNYTKPTLHEKARDAFIGVWPDFPAPDFSAPAEATQNVSAAELEKRRIKHFNTTWERGRHPLEWNNLFRVGTAPMALFKFDRSRLDAMSVPELERELWFWQLCVRSLLICEHAGKIKRQAIEGISKAIAQRGEESPGQRQDMVHGPSSSSRPDIADVIPAIFAGVEPWMAAELFLHLGADDDDDLYVAHTLGLIFRKGKNSASEDLVRRIQRRVAIIVSEVETPSETEQQTLRRTFLQHAIRHFWKMQL